MEILNLEKRITLGADILRRGQNWLKVRIPAHDLASETEIYWKGFPGNTLKQIADAALFVARFAAGACTHIYISAVPFCAKSSSVYDNYRIYMRGLMKVEGRAMKEWPSAAIVVRETNSKSSQ